MASQEQKSGTELWNLTIPPEEISRAAKQVGEIVNEIVKNYTARSVSFCITGRGWHMTSMSASSMKVPLCITNI